MTYTWFIQDAVKMIDIGLERVQVRRGDIYLVYTRRRQDDRHRSPKSTGHSMVYTVSRGIPLLLISVCTFGPL